MEPLSGYNPVSRTIIPNWALQLTRATKNKSIVDNRLCPRCHILTNSTKRCSCLTSNLYRHLANSSNKTSCLILSTAWLHGVKTWRHPRNRKYVTYRNAVRGPSHGYGQYGQKIWWNSAVVFELCEQIDRQTDKQTNSSQYFAPLPEVKYA